MSEWRDGKRDISPPALPPTEDIAVDWVSDKLYWIDALWARIEVMDIATGRRAELIRTSNHSIPRGLAVDPSSR